jgi:hypothetical protein
MHWIRHLAKANQDNCHDRFRHKADILNVLTNVRFWGKADIDQPLFTNLDL